MKSNNYIRNQFENFDSLLIDRITPLAVYDTKNFILKDLNSKTFLKLFKSFENQTNKNEKRKLFKNILFLLAFNNKKLEVNWINFLNLTEFIIKNNDLLLKYEFCDYTLKHLIENKLLCKEENFKLRDFIAYQIILTIHNIHKCGVVLRNLSTEKILIQQNGIIKFYDFQFAEVNMQIVSINSLFMYETIKMDDFNSLRHYKPPEVLINPNYYSTKGDIWSLGCILYEMYYSTKLFESHSTHEHLVEIISFYENVNVDFKKIHNFEDFIHTLMTNTKNKISFNQQIKYENIINSNNSIDKLLKDLLVFNPDDRLEIRDIILSELLFNKDQINSYNQLLQYKIESKEEDNANLANLFWSNAIITNDIYQNIIFFKEENVNNIK